MIDLNAFYEQTRFAALSSQKKCDGPVAKRQAEKRESLGNKCN